MIEIVTLLTGAVLAFAGLFYSVAFALREVSAMIEAIDGLIQTVRRRLED